MQRRIMHIDMDAFFASVEEVHNPELRGKPLIIGGDRHAKRGVVSTASYAARKFGVHSAMPLSEAIRRCPHGIFMRGNFALYHEASLTVRRVLETITPKVQVASIDEAYLDISGSLRLFGGDDAIAARVKEQIRKETGLPCTIAIAANKLVAKVGSDYAKPDGYIAIPSGEEAAFFAPMPLRKLPGIGERTCAALQSLGLYTLGDLASCPLPRLRVRFGEEAALGLKLAASGHSESPVETSRTPKSMSRETTFQTDERDWKRLEQVLHYLAERCAYALREENMLARRVFLKVRYHDFDTHVYNLSLSEPTSVDNQIVGALQTLLPKAQRRGAPVRLIGAGVAMLSPNFQQMRLFDPDNIDQWERALEGIDGLRRKWGFGCIQSARCLGVDRHKKD